MQYVLLLRGINVGGKTKVEMPQLKKTIENLGCTNVKTYINSGNVILTDTRSEKELTAAIEKAVRREFKLEIPVLLRTSKNINDLCKKIPDQWTNDKQQKTDVMFLWKAIDKPGIEKKFVIHPNIENILLLDGAVVWNISRQFISRGAGVKLMKTDLYKQMTVRNINTVRKLKDLMG